MGSIGGLIGTAGGAAGSGFSGPEGASIVNPTNAGQISSAYTGVQNSQQAQQNLVAALQGQNGLGNQSQVFNQLQGTAGQYQNIANGTGPNPAQAALNQATGQNVANQAALMAGQRGAGSNVGLMARQVAQQGAATQQQAVGQGATMQAQQQLAGLQGLANTQSQLGSMANTQAGQQIGQTNANAAAQQAEQAALINAQLGVNNSNVGMQSNINNVNGQLANTTMQGQQGLIGGVMNSIGGGLGAEGGDVEDGNDAGSVSAGDTNNPTSPDTSGDFDTSKAGVSPGNTPNDSTPSFGSDAGASALAKGFGSFGGLKDITSLMGAAGSSGGGGGGGGGIMSLAAMMAKGGAVQRMVNGGEIADEPTIDAAPVAPAPSMQPAAGSSVASKFGKFLKGGVKGSKPQAANTPSFGSGAQAMFEGASSLGKGIQKAMSSAPSSSSPDSSSINTSSAPWDAGSGNAGGPGDTMDNEPMPSPGAGLGDDIGPMEMAARGGMTHDYRSGGKVKAKSRNQKATRPGNNYANDKIPAVLSEHEIVIPRSVTMGKDPVRQSAAFVQAIIAKRKARK